MGLLDSLAKEFLPKILGSGGKNAGPLMEIVSSLLSGSQSGGLSGMVESFKRHGMEEIINSWIGTGKNLPIAPDDLIKVLGGGRLGALAEKTGLSHQDISGGLAGILPEIIDRLTPQGKMPDSSSLEEQLQAMKEKITRI